MSDDKNLHGLFRTISNALDELGSDHNMRRDRPYSGQPHTDTGARGATEIKGITFRDLRDCYVRAYCLSAGQDNPVAYAEALKGEDACICENDIFGLKGDVDPIAVAQNLSCEIEKLMGIYPNVPDMRSTEMTINWSWRASENGAIESGTLVLRAPDNSEMPDLEMDLADFRTARALVDFIERVIKIDKQKTIEEIQDRIQTLFSVYR